VTVILEPAAAGTRVSVRPAYSASYRNAITGYGFERPCRSKGVLERRLLDAAAP
jgi:hypothetical protein